MDVWTPDELKENLDQGKAVFLKLYKKGCGICKLSIPATERMEQSNIHGLTFGKILIDDHPEMLDIAETDMLPAFFVFAGGKLKGEYHGFKGLAPLEEFVSNSMNK